MYSWLLNIVGVILISVLLEVILPSGKTAVFLKHIISLFVLYVVVNPIILFFTNNYNIFKGDGISVDLNYIYNNNLNKVEYYESEIIKNIELMGYKNVSVILNGGIFEEDLSFNLAFVDLTNVENNSKSEKDKIIEDIKNVVIEIAGVSKENIVVYG